MGWKLGMRVGGGGVGMKVGRWWGGVEVGGGGGGVEDGDEVGRWWRWGVEHFNRKVISLTPNVFYFHCIVQHG